MDQQSIVPGCDATAGPFSVFALCRASLSKVNEVIDRSSHDSSPQDDLSPIDEPYVISEDVSVTSPRLSSYSEDDSVEEAQDARQEVSFIRHDLQIGSHNFWIHSLLSHYLSRVADLLQPIKHPQNPFRSIHARYAMAISANSVSGSTNCSQKSFASNKAIFHSIISTAAFHLRGPRTGKHSDSSIFDYTGRLHRMKALKYLQEVLSEPSITAETHYLRVSAILTLVTSDVRLPPA